MTATRGIEVFAWSCNPSAATVGISQSDPTLEVPGIEGFGGGWNTFCQGSILFVFLIS